MPSLNVPSGFSRLPLMDKMVVLGSSSLRNKRLISSLLLRNGLSGSVPQGATSIRINRVSGNLFSRRTAISRMPFAVCAAGCRPFQRPILFVPSSKTQ